MIEITEVIRQIIEETVEEVVADEVSKSMGNISAGDISLYSGADEKISSALTTMKNKIMNLDPILDGIMNIRTLNTSSMLEYDISKSSNPNASDNIKDASDNNISNLNLSDSGLVRIVKSGVAAMTTVSSNKIEGLRLGQYIIEFRLKTNMDISSSETSYLSLHIGTENDYVSIPIDLSITKENKYSMVYISFDYVSKASKIDIVKTSDNGPDIYLDYIRIRPYTPNIT